MTVKEGSPACVHTKNCHMSCSKVTRKQGGGLPWRQPFQHAALSSGGGRESCLRPWLQQGAVPSGNFDCDASHPSPGYPIYTHKHQLVEQVWPKKNSQISHVFLTFLNSLFTLWSKRWLEASVLQPIMILWHHWLLWSFNRGWKGITKEKQMSSHWQKREAQNAGGFIKLQVVLPSKETC